MLSLYLQTLETDEERGRFARLYACYRDLMFRAADRLLHNDMDAEDAVHQAFLAILKHFSKVRRVDAPATKAYVVLIARRKAIDILRAKSRFVDTGGNVPGGLQPSLPEDADLADAMLSLPERYREALLLRYAHGYSAAELAALWGIKKSSAQTVLWRAKKALEERLEGDPDE
ncbi:MAG: sigma-70 family RNA polymerase sigma factor [Oscillospiraceae bacterium]|nr:sigma-70 family RNA polymerase sigma factor [Oscillospiraceae bacterium]